MSKIKSMRIDDISYDIGADYSNIDNTPTFKTINNESIVGTGNIDIEGGTGTPTDVQINGTSVTSSGTANIVTEGVYNSSTNKIATISDMPDTSNFITKSVNNLDNYYNKSEIYTKTEIDSKVSSVYKYKGTVATYSSLPSTNLTAGDVYNVEADGSNYAWTGTIWDKLGGDIDLSGYQIKIDSSNKLSSDLIDDTNQTNKFVTNSEKEIWNNKSDFSGNYNDLTNKPNPPEESEYIYVSPSGDTTYATDATNIQNAIDSANTNGKVVFFRNGTYYVQAPLTIYNNTILMGNAGKNEIRTMSNSSVFTTSSNSAVSGLMIQGLKFLNQNQIDNVQRTQSGSVLGVTGRGIYVNNCRFNNYFQIFTALETNSFIVNSRFVTIFGKFANTTTDSLIEGNYINASRFAILRNSTVIANLSSTTFSNNFVDYFCTVFGSYHSNTSTHSSVVGNTFDRCMSVFHDKIQRMAITGNNFSNMTYQSNIWAPSTSIWLDKYVKPDPSNTNLYVICDSGDTGATLATTVLSEEKWSVFKIDDKTAEASSYTLNNHVFSDVVFTGNIGEKVDYYFYISSSMVRASNIGVCTNNCIFDNNTILKGTGGTAYSSSEYDITFSALEEDGEEQSDYEMHLRSSVAYGYLENTYFDFMDMNKYATLSELPSATINTNNCVSFPYMKAVITNDGDNNGVWINNEGTWEKATGKENKGKITVSGTEKTPSSHTLSWTDNGITYSYEVVTV